MKLNEMIDKRNRDKGEREGLIRKKDEENDNKNMIYLKLISGFSTMNMLKQKIPTDKHDEFGEKNGSDGDEGIGKHYSYKDEIGSGKNEEILIEDDPKFELPKKKGKKKKMKSLQIKGLKKHHIGFNNKCNLETKSVETDISESSFKMQGDMKNHKRRKKNRKHILESEEGCNHKKSGKKRKIVKRFAKKAGSKTWKGVKMGWNFLCTGLRSFSVPFGGVWDVSDGVMNVVKEWRMEKMKKQEWQAREKRWTDGEIITEESGCRCGGYGGCGDGWGEERSGGVGERKADCREDLNEINKGLYAGKQTDEDEEENDDFADDSSSCIKDENNNNKKCKRLKKKKQKKI